MSHSTTNSKEEDEWQAVMHYIRQCPHVPPSHPAIVAALAGIDKERQQRERDRKLQTKFALSSNPEPNKHDSDTVLVAKEDDDDNELMRMTRKRNQTNGENMEDDDGDEEEWQAVDKATTSPTAKNAMEDTAMASTTTDDHEDTSLVPHAVQLLSHYNVLVSSPLAALFVVVHATLVHLGFECTGVPPSSNDKDKGFAAPIRPLTTFLPAGFGQDASAALACFQLRYRGPSKRHILRMQCSKAGDNASVVQVTWTTGQGGEPAATWEFALHQYFNMESWTTAQAGQTPTSISPLLHYKHLAQLLHTFVQRLDLEGTTTKMANGKPLYGEAQLPAVHAAPTNASSMTQPAQPLGNTPAQPQQPTEPGRGYEIPSTLGGAFPGLNGFGGGQFSGDLAPGGIGGIGPGNNGRNGLPGNLMGPNHPAFHHPNDQDGFLRPRFDPVGPPPTRPEDFDGNGTPHPPAPGEIPNQDHFRPPNTRNRSRRNNNGGGSHRSSGSGHMYM